MSTKCSKCVKEITDVKLSIACVECREVFHAVTCTKIRSLTAFKSMGARKDVWKCENCSNDTGSLSGRSDTDTGETNSILAAIANLSEELNNKIDSRFDALQVNMASITEEINNFKKDVTLVKEAQSLDSKEIEAIKKENSNLKNEVGRLSVQVQDLQQYSRINNIIIAGIPKTPGEDVLAILENVAEVLRVNFHHMDISAAHRLPVRSGDAKHPPIVVQFVSRATKNVWIEAKKAKKRLTTEELRGRLPKNDIYLNEHLTAPGMALFSKAKEMRRAGKVAHVWVRDCKVFVRRQERGPALKITSLTDLEFPPLDS